MRRYCSSVSALTSASPVITPAFRHARSTASTDSQAAASATSKPFTRSSTRTSAPSASSRSTSARPIPDAPPVTSAVSGNKDDLAHVPALLDQTVSVRGAFERERGADVRADHALVPQLDELADGLAHDLRPQPHQP